MSSGKLVQLASTRRALNCIADFLIPALPFLNGHLNNFIAKSLWDVHLNDKLKHDLETVSFSQLENYAKTLADIHKQTRNIDHLSNVDKEVPIVNFETSSLHDIVQQIGQLLLLSAPLNPEDLKEILTQFDKDHSSERDHNLCEETENIIQRKNDEIKGNFDIFMTAKKMHEVEVMSDLIARLANIQYSIPSVDSNNKNDKSEINYLVDVGSGKGYLSSFVMLLYDFKVLAIDSCASNSAGSALRASKLKKNWQAFLRRAQDRRDGTLSKRGKHWRQKQYRKQQNNILDGSKSDDQQQLLNQSEGEDFSTTAVVDSKLLDADKIREMKHQKRLDEVSEQLKTLTLYVTQDMQLSELVEEHFHDREEDSNSCINGGPPFGLIGLHTCGSLGADSIRLFEKNKDAKFLCNVPCCVHLLEESYCPDWEKYSVVGTTPLPNYVIDNLSFPLSQTLHERKFYLGRSARMMSAHTLHRMDTVEGEDNLLPQSFTFRVILEALIHDKLGHNLLEYPKVGRNVGAKCQTFHEYVRKCLEKMNLTEDIKMSDDEIKEFYERHIVLESKLYKYFVFRNFFSALVERCIILDRLASLLESDGDIDEAFMVQVFDPFVSPRCHALVALRR